MTTPVFIAVVAVGVGVGFLSGLFGKGGSAVATPLLAAAGIPAVVAVASPLPATIPTTIAASAVYWRRGWLERRVLAATLAFGVPATVMGALATRWVNGSVLVLATDALIAGIGLRLLWSQPGERVPVEHQASARRSAVIGAGVGFASGLLANSGGALLAPLYLTVLGLPIKRTFATSLTAATVLAIPATAIHIWLGHINWAIVATLAATSVPFSILGSRVAVATRAPRLERMYAFTLTVLGSVLLARGLL